MVQGVDMCKPIGVLLLTALLFSACGGDDESTSDERPADIGEVSGTVEDAIITPTPTAIPAVIEPLPLSYTVQEGDLLGNIAQTFNVPLGAIVAVNDFDNPDLIQVGQEIIIPTEEEVAEWEAEEEVRLQAEATAEAAATPTPEETPSEGDDTEGDG